MTYPHPVTRIGANRPLVHPPMDGPSFSRRGGPEVSAVRSDPAPAAGRRSVILEADDLGLLYAFNEGIRRAFRAGRLTSTCLRANGYAYEHAVRDVVPSCPGIGIGVHLCLNEAECVSRRDRVPLLLGADGRLRPGFLWLMRLARTAAGCEQIEREFRAQIEKVLADGLRPDHLNSHQHVHMIPEIFRIACRLAVEYGIRCIRLVRELPYGAGGFGKRIQPLTNANYLKHLLLNRFALGNDFVAREHGLYTTDYFVGVNYTAHMNLGTIIAGLAAVPYGSVEVLLHPAIGPDPRDRVYPRPYLRGYAAAPQRAFEVRALSVPELWRYLDRESWTATTFAAWSSGQQSRRPRASMPEIPVAVRQTCDSTAVSAPPWVSAAQADSRAFAELVISQARPGQRILDVGTGTGIIAICLARLGYDVTASDISRAAVRAARRNARRNGVAFPCVRSDLLESVEGRFDLIAFNPPYNWRPDTFWSNLAKNLLRRVPLIRRSSGVAMPRPVLRYHQRLIERLAAQAPSHLNRGGAILLHAYESEVAALSSVLPPGAEVEILHHPRMINRTVGMRIRLPEPGES